MAPGSGHSRPSVYKPAPPAFDGSRATIQNEALELFQPHYDLAHVFFRLRQLSSPPGIALPHRRAGDRPPRRHHTFLARHTQMHITQQRCWYR